ncbi:hypothetical protein [Bartonella sp. DGB2]|uniref:hypothetical protein n=1 Tax=Bartonella sp. DGB2 TaxID=3388426 RepID=UPI00399010D0
MPEKQIPPDWLSWFGMMLSTALAGIFGAFVRQLANHDKSCWQRVCEWVGGGVLAIYASPTVSYMLYHLLLRFDMVGVDDGLSPNNIMGLAGFICGAVGVSSIELLLSVLRYYFHVDKTR